MKTVLIAATAVAALLAGSANAAVTFYSYGVGAPIDPLVTNFGGDTLGAQPTTAAAGFSWAGGGSGVILDTTSGIGAEPAVFPGAYGTGNYLSVQGGDSETLNVSNPDIHDLIIYSGSLDNYNTISFGGPGVSYTGTQLGLISGAANGAQTAANTNGVFVFSFSAPVTSVTFSSSSNSYEIASIEAGVPEPAVWGMMLVGFGGMGAAMRARRKQAAATA